MRNSLLKKNTLIEFSFSNPNYYNELYGRNFEVEYNEGNVIFSFDLSKNLSSRNSGLNIYEDAKYLADNYYSLKNILIHDESLINPISKTKGMFETTKWNIVMSLDNFKEIKKIGKIRYWDDGLKNLLIEFE